MVSLPYKLLGTLAALAILATGSYWAGYHGEHLRLVAYRAEVGAAAKVQAANVAKQEVENADQTRVVIANLAADRDTLNAKLKRLRDRESSSRMPKVASGQQGNDETSSEPSRACQNSQFYANALNDALLLQTWQDWAKRQHIPVQ